MGLTTLLETESAKRIAHVEDPKNLLRRLLPALADESFHCLRFIDPYQNTVFNQLQMERLRAELSRVREKAASREEQDLLARIDELARRCQAEAHLYLKFLGD